MARPLIIPNPENADLSELIEAARVGYSETVVRCTAIQMLLVGISREQGGNQCIFHHIRLI